MLRLIRIRIFVFCIILYQFVVQLSTFTLCQYANRTQKLCSRSSLGMKFRGQTIIKYTQFVRNQQRFDVSIPAFFCFCIQNWERESRMQIHVLKPACFSRICYVHGIRQYISVERSIFQYVATRGTSNTLESNRTHEQSKSREEKKTQRTEWQNANDTNKNVVGGWCVQCTKRGERASAHAIDICT